MDAGSSQVFLNYVTAAGIILGGLFAAWKWGVAEVLRRRAEERRERDENPDLEGTVEVAVSGVEGGGCLLAIESRWRNNSPRNVFLNTEETQISLLPVSLRSEADRESEKVCKVVRESGSALLSEKPYQGRNNVRIGAGSSLVIRRHVLVKGHSHVMVRVMLVRREKSAAQQRLLWTAETLVACEPPSRPAAAGAKRKSPRPGAPAAPD